MREETLSLYELIGHSIGWGSDIGKILATSVQARVEAVCPRIVRLSLTGITQMDVSCASALVRLAAQEKERGYCLLDLEQGSDLWLNWSAAAHIGKHPLFAWTPQGRYYQLGPDCSVGLRDVLAEALKHEQTTSHAIAQHLGLQLTNVCNKLSALWKAGYVLREATCSSSGGIEYVYHRIA